MAQRGELLSRETADALAEYFMLTDEERRQLLPSGCQTLIHNRVGCLLEAPRQGFVKITDEGSNVSLSVDGTWVTVAR